MTKLITTALLTVLLGIYLGTIKIAIGIGAALLLLEYSTRTKKSTSTQTQKEPEEDTVLHPVVYEDAGEPPNLYPEEGKIRVYPDGRQNKLSAHGMVSGMGNVLKGATKGVIKLLKS